MLPSVPGGGLHPAGRPGGCSSSLQEWGAGPALDLTLEMLLVLSEVPSSCLQQASTAGGEKYSLRVLSPMFPSAEELSLAEPELSTAGKLPALHGGGKGFAGPGKALSHPNEMAQQGAWGLTLAVAWEVG